MLVIFKGDGLTLISTAEGAPVESVVDQIPEGAPWVVVDGELPSAPRDTWIVDWDTGVITVDPSWTPPQKTVVTDWEGLVAEIMSNSEFKAAWIAASSIDPTIAWSLSTAFSMVGQGYPGNFNNIFNTMCELAQVTSEQREVWADIGATFNAPSEFLDIVRGVINGE